MNKTQNKRSDNSIDENMSKMNINWYPGHMAKTRKRIIEDMKLVDVVIELLDSRIPIASRNPDIQNLTKNKKKIIVLNKIDLADSMTTKKWQEYFSKETVTLLTDSNSGAGIEKVSKKIEEMMKEVKEKEALRGRINKTTRVMILGIPNVGKSSFINRISKKKSMQVANYPGVTRSKQWIRIGASQELLDTPGVLWPKFESEEVSLNLAFTGTIKDDILELTEICYELVKRLMVDYKAELQKRYKITEEEWKEVNNQSNSAYELMKLIAKKRGAIISGGRVDDEKISRIILEEFRSGKIGKISLEQP